MRCKILFLGVLLLPSIFAKAQAPTVPAGQGFVNGVGIGVPAGLNFSDAALHIKVDPNTFYSSGNGQQLFYGETSNAKGDNIRIMNAKGGTGNSFAPWLLGTTASDLSIPPLHLGANSSSALDLANGSPMMIFSVRKAFIPATSLETAVASQDIANRPMFQWVNNSIPLMTMYPTTAANGDARLAFGTTLPAFKMDIATPGGGGLNDGIRISNTGTSSASLRLKANSTGGHDWGLQSSGSANGVGAGHIFLYDYTASKYRFFINGGSGNVGIGNDNALTSLPLAKLDINTGNSNDGIRVTQTGTTAASLSLVGGGVVGTPAGQARKWILFSTGSGNSPQGAGHLTFFDGTTNVERMRIHQNGYVGINTVNSSPTLAPTHLFHVKSNVVNGTNLDPVRFETLNAASDSGIVTIDNTGVLHTRTIASFVTPSFINNCTTVGQVPVVSSVTGDLACSQITDNGIRVGINNLTPQLKLDINTSSTNDGIRVTQTGTTAASLSLVGGGAVGTGAGQARRWILFSTGTGNSPQGAGHLTFFDGTNNIERMRIHQNGYVGINTFNSTGLIPTNMLHVKSSPSSTGGNLDPVRFETLNGAKDSVLVTVDDAGVLHTRSIASIGTSFSNNCTTVGQVPVVNSITGDLACSQITDNGTNVGVGYAAPSYNLDVNGSLHCTTLSVTSDKRYKKDIFPLLNANQIISRLQGVTYNFNREAFKAQKFEDKKQIGFIAQDVEKVLPEAVSKDKDGFYAINYIAIIPVLTEAIKTQNSKIDALENEISEIKEMLKAQSKTIHSNGAESETKTIIKIFPNPVNGSSISIEHFTQNESPVYVSITDMQGRQMSRKQFNSCAHCINKFSIDVSQLGNGAYTVVLSNEGKITTQTFIVAK